MYDVLDAPRLLLNLSTEDPGRPRVTHYDTIGDARIELSGRVLVNWANKAANLLVEEFDVAPGSFVVIDLPVGHWRAVYWALAAWSAGACVIAADGPQLPPGAGKADVVITTRPESWADTGAGLVAVVPAALARSFPGELGGAIDEAATLAGYDDLGPETISPGLDDPALIYPGTTLSYRQMYTDIPGDRTLLLISDHTRAGEALTYVLAVLAAGGSVVLAPEAPSTQIARLSATEQAVVAPT